MLSPVDRHAGLQARLRAAESAARSVPSNIPADAMPPTCARVVADATAKGVLGSALYRVPPDYYDRPLAARAQLLGCPPDRLCKTIIFENASGTAEGGDVPLHSARYLAVVVQYVAKISLDVLGRLLRQPGGGGPEPRLAMAPPEVGAALTGFGFNGVSPLGMRASMPVLVAKAIAQLPSPALIWLGGGEADVKLRLFVPQLLRPRVLCGAVQPVVADVTQPRDEDDPAGGE
jgi:prolyl-tRNA editing enzyme YbaK/EbsC (Cys-tRNA(Pro) deacylase)